QCKTFYSIYDHPYSSALLKLTIPLFVPPGTNTFPFTNVDAVCTNRAVLMLSVLVQSPVNESYNSALLKVIPQFCTLLCPPANKTFPFTNVDAV
ncbi:unnamed protein product, partial [Rotaria sp. Silwood2]